jgi:hypothetical protein
VDQEAMRGLASDGDTKLLDRPLRRRMRSDAEVENPADRDSGQAGSCGCGDNAPGHKKIRL